MDPTSPHASLRSACVRICPVIPHESRESFLAQLTPRLLPTTNLGDPVGFGLYWAVNCNFLIAESYPELCAKSVPVRSARLKLRLGYYVYNVTDAYLNSADNYLEDVAILELFKSVNPDKWPARLACVPKPEDVFEQSKDGPPFTLVAKRATKHSSKFVGEQPLLLALAVPTRNINAAYDVKLIFHARKQARKVRQKPGS